MIIFKNLKYKNFLSTGNNWTEVDFLKNKTTLVVGHNGAGKSTMLDALSFALFGKPHRNINKPQLVNSINNKDCRVEVEFTAVGNTFKIVRGLKPQLFEIYKNGEMINQSSHAKEYQKLLEQNILKLNHKSFHQIVVLGSSSFIPFMQLAAQARRDVIEDLLDINIFSKMNQILKEKNSTLKDQLRETEYQIDLETNKINTQRKYINDINRINKDLKDQKQESIKGLRDEIKLLAKENEEYVNEIESLTDTEKTIKENTDKYNQLKQYETQFKTDIKNIVKDAKFFEDNSTCPTCSQDIPEELKTVQLESAKGRAGTLKAALEGLDVELKKTNDLLKEANDQVATLRDLQSKINFNSISITRLESQITGIMNEIENLTDTTSDISVAKDDLQKFINDRDSLLEDKLKYSEQYQYNSVISEMLKDTGIKTKIVKQYLPVINKLVNQYLQILDFFVHFDLDESFSEQIRSRHRDNFSYDSFSEGEKQRIDLALLFTWRQIAKMKNSVATNLLILDETFDSSLDYEGVDNLMKIIYSLDDKTNVFVISHKGDILDGKFEHKIEFTKEKNFSKIK